MDYLIENIAFENTKDMLVYSDYVAEHFLSGTWKTTNGYYFLSVEGYPLSKISYNLPHQDMRLAYRSKIHKGVYSISDGNTSISVFKITILNANSIKLFCHKNGTTYTLYRQ